MKSFKSIIALAMCAVAIVGCKSKNEPSVPTQQEIETKIIGKWKKISQDGVPVPTNLRSVFSFSNNGKGTASRSAQGLTGYIWSNKIETKYSVTGNILHIVNDIEFFDKVSNISADTFSAHEKQIIGDKVIESEVTRQRVYADYSQDIIGMWEGVEITGYETYGNAEHRILYNADGTYVYFVKSGDDWVPSSNVDNEYNVDGDWLATRWRPEAGADYNYEWWDIDEIKDGIMKWSALREKEDGTRFNTTFTWKKVK